VSAWSNVRLDKVATVIRGVTYAKRDVIQIPAEKDIPILRAGNINGRLITENDLVWLPCAAISQEHRKKRDAYRFPDNHHIQVCEWQSGP
jgi:hypothetical protein